MGKPGLILLGMALTGLTSIMLGRVIVRLLALPLARSEAWLLGYLLGSAALSTTVFSLGVFWALKPFWFGLVSASTLAAFLYLRAWRSEPRELPPIGGWWRFLIAASFAVYGTFTFFHAMAPEMSPDGMAYHLGLVSRYVRQGGFDWHTTNMYASLTAGIEMLYTFAFAFGKHSAAALVHWQFLIVLPLLVVSFGRRFGFPQAGAIAGLLVFLSPVAAMDGSCAYVDVAAAAVAFGFVYLLLLWERERSRGLLIATGLLAGFAYACKMTLFTAPMLAVLFVFWAAWRAKDRPFRSAAIVGACAAALILPWVVKNVLMVGNPAAPFLNRYFPNPYVHVILEEEWRSMHRDYYGHIKSPKEIPLEVTVRGGVLNGIVGPIFLLVPLGLLALRWAVGRRILLAAAMFAATYPSNIGTRFLLTSLPFLAFAIAMPLASSRFAATAVVLFHAFTAWPDVIQAYGDEYAWRLDRFRFTQAIRKESEDTFLRRMAPAYSIARLIEETTPPNARVLTFSGVAEAYTSREIIVAYQAGYNNIVGELLVAGVAVDYQPDKTLEFAIEPRLVEKLRIVQTKSGPRPWAVTEIRAYEGDNQVSKDAGWRLKAHPNPWDVQFAFDSCPITRWKSWQNIEPGMYIELRFSRRQPLTHVQVDTAADQVYSAARLEIETAPGKWEVASKTPVVKPLPPIQNARRTAADDLKRMGITHLSVNRDDSVYDDLYRNRPLWGITLLGEAGHHRLYRID